MGTLQKAPIQPMPIALAVSCGTVLATHALLLLFLLTVRTNWISFGGSALLGYWQLHGLVVLLSVMGTNFSLWARLVNHPLLLMIHLPFVFAVVWGPSRTWRGSMESSGRSWNPTSRWSFSTNQHAELHLSEPYHSSPCLLFSPACSCCDKPVMLWVWLQPGLEACKERLLAWWRAGLLH